MNARTYYDLDFPPDSVTFDGNNRGTPLAVQINAESSNNQRVNVAVLLDQDQVENLIEYLQAWVAEREGLEPPVGPVKWKDGHTTRE